MSKSSANVEFEIFSILARESNRFEINHFLSAKKCLLITHIKLLRNV